MEKWSEDRLGVLRFLVPIALKGLDVLSSLRGPLAGACAPRLRRGVHELKDMVWARGELYTIVGVVGVVGVVGLVCPEDQRPTRLTRPTVPSQRRGRNESYVHRRSSDGRRRRQRRDDLYNFARARLSARSQVAELRLSRAYDDGLERQMIRISQRWLAR